MVDQLIMSIRFHLMYAVVRQLTVNIYDINSCFVAAMLNYPLCRHVATFCLLFVYTPIAFWFSLSMYKIINFLEKITSVSMLLQAVNQVNQSTNIFFTSWFKAHARSDFTNLYSVSVYGVSH